MTVTPLKSQKDNAFEDPTDASGLSVCPNCGESVSNRFCSSCGQKVQSLREPVHRFIGEALDEFLGLDGRLWRTLGLLLFRPGRLTQAYLDGRRAHYLRPLRIYVATTLLFFFLISVLDPSERMREVIDGQIADGDTSMTVEQRQDRIAELLEIDATILVERAQVVDSLSARFAALESAYVSDSTSSAIPDSLLMDRQEEVQDAQADLLDEQEDQADERARIANRRERFEWQQSVLDGFPPDSLIVTDDLRSEAELRFPGESGGPNVNFTMPNWLPRSAAVQRLNNARTNEEASLALAELGRNTIERLPVVMFLLLPLFAFLMKVIFVRRNWYYTEHLVFALHTHAFAFVIFSFIVVANGFSFVPDEVALIFSILGLTIPLYFYIAMKRVYRQGWIKTALKMWLIGWIYFFILMAGIVIAVMLAAAIG